MVIFLAVLIAAAAGASFLAGLYVGRRLVWRQMKTIRPFGVECLEQLAKKWNAKLEIVDARGARPS